MPVRTSGIPTTNVVPYSDVSGTLDQRSAYVERAKRLAIDAKPGIEKFAYEVFGPQFIGSLALALNPYSKFDIPSVAITPANRMTKLQCIWGLTRKYHSYVRTDLDFNLPDVSTPNLFDRTAADHTTIVSSNSTVTTTAQPFISGLRSDTTRRTRPAGSDHGTFELRAPYLLAPPRHTDWWSHVLSHALAGGYEQVTDSHAHRVTDDIGPGFAVSQATVDALVADEVSFCNTKMSQNGLRLVKQALPAHKRFDITYNLVELRDLPMMMKETCELALNTARLLSAKGAGKAYLNQQFGWDSYVSAVKDMLTLPVKISRQVNQLIARRGLPTRFVSSLRGSDKLGVTPSLVYTLHPGETEVSHGSIDHRDWELRCVLNYTLNFPKVEVPKLRNDLILKLWGVKPTPETIYNLVPWTWLIDWFTGIGDYISVMEQIYDDDNLFNYGFLTYSSEAKSTFTLESRVTDSTSWTMYGSSGSSSVIRKKSHSAVLGLRYQKRIDISTLAGVKAVSRPTTLSADQTAILGALLTKWFHN